MGQAHEAADGPNVETVLEPGRCAPDLYRSGMTVREISAELGISNWAVRRKLDDAGVVRRKAGQRPARQPATDPAAGPATPWQQLLLDVLRRRQVVGVLDTVARHVGRVPTRAEITAARRAANRLAQDGGAQLRRVPALGRSGHRTHPVLLRLDANPDALDLAAIAGNLGAVSGLLSGSITGSMPPGSGQRPEAGVRGRDCSEGCQPVR